MGELEQSQKDQEVGNELMALITLDELLGEVKALLETTIKESLASDSQNTFN